MTLQITFYKSRVKLKRRCFYETRIPTARQSVFSRVGTMQRERSRGGNRRQRFHVRMSSPNREILCDSHLFEWKQAASERLEFLGRSVTRRIPRRAFTHTHTHTHTRGPVSPGTLLSVFNRIELTFQRLTNNRFFAGDRAGQSGRRLATEASFHSERKILTSPREMRRSTSKSRIYLPIGSGAINTHARACLRPERPRSCSYLR